MCRPPEDVQHLAGTIPAAWVSLSSPSSFGCLGLDLSYNSLTGTIPQGGGSYAAGSSKGLASPVVLSPMSSGPGLCGKLPAAMNMTSATGAQLQDDLPACPGGELFRSQCLQCLLWPEMTHCDRPIACPALGHSPKVNLLASQLHAFAAPGPAGKTTTVVASCVGAGAALALALAGLLAWRARRARNERVYTRVARSVLLDLGNTSSQMQSLVIELDKAGNPILLGRGTFGEVNAWHLVRPGGSCGR